MKIALTQHNPIVGDFTGNCIKILEAVESAAEKQCDLVLFPDLALSGYPPKSLLTRPAFWSAENLALEKLSKTLARQYPQIAILLGVIPSPQTNKETSLKTAALLHNNTTLFLTNKSPENVFSLKNDQFILIIGEDYSSFSKLCSKKSSATAVINIAASYFTINKREKHREVISQLCKKHAVNFLFCNQVGGQEGRIFDGASMVINTNGKSIVQANFFTEDFIIYDTEDSQSPLQTTQQNNEEQSIYQALVLGVRDYVTKSGFSSVLLGLSGGIDSALTAAIAVEALGAENVMGVAMPSRYSSKESLIDAKQLAKNLACRFEVQPIDDLFSAFNAQLASLFTGKAEDATEQNLQARIRGNLLMAISNKFGSMLLSTGNRSESAVGYCTLYGDMCGGLAVIADLPKHLVYRLSHYVNRRSEIIPKRILSKPPSAELKFDQKDQDELPDYDTLDEIIHLYMEENKGLEEIISTGIPRNEAEDVIRRIHLNEYKRKQAPLALCISEKGFNNGWDYPVLHKFME